MPLSFLAEPDEPLLAAAVRHVSRQLFAALRSLGLVLGLVGVFGWLSPSGGLPFLALFLFLGLMLGVVFVELVIRRAVSMSVRRVGRPTTYRFSGDGVGFSTDLMSSELRWAAIGSTEELPGQVILTLAFGGFVTVPVGGLSAERLDELRGLLRENVGSAAGRSAPLGVRPPTP